MTETLWNQTVYMNEWYNDYSFCCQSYVHVPWEGLRGGGGGSYKLPTKANFVDLGKVENIFYVIGPNGICLPGG